MFGSHASHKVIHRLEEAGYEAVFVGGAVRDYVLGKPAKDIDIATSAEPDEIKMVFSNTVDIGIAHGTVLVIVDGEPIEVTTYREEGIYTDHRRPDNVQFIKTLREDLLRRDFTMNALAMTKDGKLIDLFGGRKDIGNKLIRAVGIPSDRFHEDALRMVRAIRFSSVLNFDIEEVTLQAINDNANRIQHVSIERLKVEMDKLFMGINPVKAFSYLATSNLGHEIPLYSSKIEELKRAVPFASTSEGWAFFATVEGFHPSEIAKAYKLSKDEKKFISTVHEAFMSRTSGEFTIDEYYTYDILVLKAAEKFYRSVNINSPTVSDVELEERKKLLPIQSKQDLAVDGKDLIEWTGLAGGQWTGKWIEKIEQAVLNGICDNKPTTIKDWFMNDFKCEK